MSFWTGKYRGGEEGVGGSHANGTMPWRMKDTIIRKTIQSTGSGARNYTEEEKKTAIR